VLVVWLVLGIASALAPVGPLFERNAEPAQAA
jgi:hypothetical protein